MRILNLYAGIGGNRKLWGDEHEITSVELNSDIANYYKKLYPKDIVVIGDAHEYLLNHFAEFDFIWASPPCQTHSRINTDSNNRAKFIDMKLYQEIIFLEANWYKGIFVVENVIPYYLPLIQPTINIDRHLFWCNFRVNILSTNPEKPMAAQNANNTRYGFSLKGVKMNQRKDQILRNLVNPVIGEHFLNSALGIYKENTGFEQTELF
jgi:DNA (cytosine-5)-methyltransferase 1